MEKFGNHLFRKKRKYERYVCIKSMFTFQYFFVLIIGDSPDLCGLILLGKKYSLNKSQNHINTFIAMLNQLNFCYAFTKYFFKKDHVKVIPSIYRVLKIDKSLLLFFFKKGCLLLQ